MKLVFALAFAAALGAADYDLVIRNARIVDGSVSEFIETFAEALVIVLAVSFLSLGWRTGIVVALSVPLVLAIVLLTTISEGAPKESTPQTYAAVARPAWAPDWIVATPVLAASTVALWLALQAT